MGVYDVYAKCLKIWSRINLEDIKLRCFFHRRIMAIILMAPWPWSWMSFPFSFKNRDASRKWLANAWRMEKWWTIGVISPGTAAFCQEGGRGAACSGLLWSGHSGWGPEGLECSCPLELPRVEHWGGWCLVFFGVACHTRILRKK